VTQFIKSQITRQACTASPYPCRRESDDVFVKCSVASLFSAASQNRRGIKCARAPAPSGSWGHIAKCDRDARPGRDWKARYPEMRQPRANSCRRRNAARRAWRNSHLIMQQSFPCLILAHTAFFCVTFRPACAISSQALLGRVFFNFTREASTEACPVVKQVVLRSSGDQSYTLRVDDLYGDWLRVVRRCRAAERESSNRSLLLALRSARPRVSRASSLIPYVPWLKETDTMTHANARLT
jgi:hypothetical protein